MDASVSTAALTRALWTSRARLPAWRRGARFARTEAGVSARTTHARAGSSKAGVSSPTTACLLASASGSGQLRPGVSLSEVSGGIKTTFWSASRRGDLPGHQPARAGRGPPERAGCVRTIVRVLAEEPVDHHVVEVARCLRPVCADRGGASGVGGEQRVACSGLGLSPNRVPGRVISARTLRRHRSSRQ
jgi:hypothetical protein